MKGKLLIDCLGVLVGQQRGAERFICRLTKELAVVAPETFAVLVNRHSAEYFVRTLGREHCIVLPISGRSRVLRMLVQMTFGPVVTRLLRPRLYVSSSVFPTVGFACPTAAFLYDLMMYHFPEIVSPLEWELRAALLRLSLPHLDAIFTISGASAKDIRARFGAACIGPVHVVPCGTDPCVDQRGYDAADASILGELELDGRPFVLSVLGGKTYKNQSGLAAAAAELARRGRPIEIVVVGDAVRVFQRLACPLNLRVLGVVSDQVLATLYRSARALVFPTFSEGFGLPVIEAQAAGLVVVCSDVPVLREVGGEGAIYVDPHSPEVIADGIQRALEDAVLRTELIARGRENAARFTWRRAAEAFLAACDETAHRGAGDTPAWPADTPIPRT